MVFVTLLATVHLWALMREHFFMSSLSQIYQESPGFPRESPLVKAEFCSSVSQFPLVWFFFFCSVSLTQTALPPSLLNELSGELSHVSTHRSRHTRQQSKAVACIFALTLFITCKITEVDSNMHLNGCILIDSCLCPFPRAAQTGFCLREQITHTVTMNAF